MSSFLNEEQIDDLLAYIDTKNPNIWKDGEKLICCPVHGESNPSMGVSVEKQVCHCFSCNFAGDFAKLLVYSKPEEFGFKSYRPLPYSASYRKAEDFLRIRYDLDYCKVAYRSHNIKRYEQIDYLRDEIRIEKPRYKLAPFKSGKETYKYFFDRGFSKKDMREFMIGRDTDNRTVTIPVFYENNKLAGIIGRYIDSSRKKNQRYKIYDGFKRSALLYPLNKAKPIQDTVILVEGQFDAIRMYKLGFTNTFAIMTNNLSKDQAEWLVANCSKVIWVGDNDDRGVEGREYARKLLRNKVDFKIVDYPNYGKDVCDWSDEDIKQMIEKAHLCCSRKLNRLI